MAGDARGHGGPTRRECVTFGGAVLGGGMIAGCTGSRDSTPTTAETTAGAPTGTATATDGSYTVAMEPVGEVTGDARPFDRERVAAIVAGDV